DQLQPVPPAGHPAVEIEKNLEGGDERVAPRLLQAQLEDRAPQSLHGAPEGDGGLIEGREPAVFGERLGDLYLLQRVDDVLEYVVVQVAGYAVALGEVLDDGDEILRTVRGVAEYRDGQVDPDDGPVLAEIALLGRVGSNLAGQ
ncbi:MAG TPA: hypothetical protein VFH32_04665, partial [Rubrobacteraceae bacterium]|nr:hypothetical protein [Rubrobacteraceae bacterium]